MKGCNHGVFCLRRNFGFLLILKSAVTAQILFQNDESDQNNYPKVC